MKYAIIVIAALVGFVLTNKFLNRGEWYLGCADAVGQEYLIKVDSKPEIREGFIVIDDDTFITPQAGMTCKIIPVSEVEAKAKVTLTSNPVI